MGRFLQSFCYFTDIPIHQPIFVDDILTILWNQSCNSVLYISFLYTDHIALTICTVPTLDGILFASPFNWPLVVNWKSYPIAVILTLSVLYCWLLLGTWLKTVNYIVSTITLLVELQISASNDGWSFDKLVNWYQQHNSYMASHMFG